MSSSSRASGLISEWIGDSEDTANHERQSSRVADRASFLMRGQTRLSAGSRDVWDLLTRYLATDTIIRLSILDVP